MTAALQNILCIDDEQDIIEVAKMALETVGGFQVTACNSGQEGIDTARTLQPDVILLDVMMPEMDGPATLEKMKATEDINNIPVVFMTARVQPAEVKEYLAMGAAGVIEKPFDPMSLSTQVTEIWQTYNKSGDDDE